MSPRRIPPEMRAGAVRISTSVLRSGVLVPVDALREPVEAVGFVPGTVTLVIQGRVIFPGDAIDWIDDFWSTFPRRCLEVRAGDGARGSLANQSLAYELTPDGNRVRVEGWHHAFRAAGVAGVEVFSSEVVRAGRVFWNAISAGGRARAIAEELALLDRLGAARAPRR